MDTYVYSQNRPAGDYAEKRLRTRDELTSILVPAAARLTLTTAAPYISPAFPSSPPQQQIPYTVISREAWHLSAPLVFKACDKQCTAMVCKLRSEHKHS